MYETKRARKRKFVPASPPSARKKRAAIVSSELVIFPAEVAPEKKSPAKQPQVRKSRIHETQSSDSLLPIRPSKLNTTFNVEKRTHSQAFGEDIESRPEKRIETEKGGDMSAGQSVTDSMTQEQTKLVPFFVDSSPGQYNPDTENIVHVDQEDSKDLFDDDDACIEEFLEFEKLFAETASTLPASSKGAAKPIPEPSVDTHGKAPSHSNATSSPMKPFVRPFAPLPSSQDASPAGSIVSPLHRSPLCFRIAEALRYISHTFFASPSTHVKALNLEVYAILHARVDNGGASIVTLADIFFPHKPPYLMAIANNTMMAMASTQNDICASSSQLEKMKDNLSRAVIQVTPNEGTQPAVNTGNPISPVRVLAERYTTTVLKLEKADWKEIQRVKEILDGKQGADEVSRIPALVSALKTRKPPAITGAVNK